MAGGPADWLLSDLQGAAEPRWLGRPPRPTIRWLEQRLVTLEVPPALAKRWTLAEFAVDPEAFTTEPTDGI